MVHGQERHSFCRRSNGILLKHALSRKVNCGTQVLTTEQIINFNKAISSLYSIDYGIIKPDILESIIETPQRFIFGQEIFPTIYDKSASILESIIRLHPFIDGNKRTSPLSVFEFLLMNNHFFFIPLGAPRFLVKVATYKGEKEDENANLIKAISKWIEAHSAERGDLEKLLAILRRYKQIFRLLYISSKFPVFRFFVSILLANLLQLKIYDNPEIQAEGISKFLEHTWDRIKKFKEEDFEDNNS